jgi:hypothetical protein
MNSSRKAEYGALAHKIWIQLTSSSTYVLSPEEFELLAGSEQDKSREVQALSLANFAFQYYLKVRVDIDAKSATFYN